MAVENAQTLDQLDTASPPDSANKAEGAAQLRQIKIAVKGSFPSLVGSTTATKRLLDGLGATQPTGSNNDLPASTQFVQTAVLQAATAQLPGQAGNSGKFLRTDGANVSWQLAPVTTVAGRTGDVTLTKTDVGLPNVDNTSDANKPVSTTQQAALNLKANKAGDTFTGTIFSAIPGGNWAVETTTVAQTGNAKFHYAWVGRVSGAGTYSMFSYYEPGVGSELRLAVENSTYRLNAGGQGSSPGGWVSTSDMRVKSGNTRISGALAKVQGITGYTGIRNDQPQADGTFPRRAHLFAQEVYDVLPEAVIVPATYNRAANTGDLLALDHNGVIALLVEAVKELNGQVKALRTQAGGA